MVSFPVAAIFSATEANAGGVPPCPPGAEALVRNAQPPAEAIAIATAAASTRTTVTVTAIHGAFARDSGSGGFGLWNDMDVPSVPGASSDVPYGSGVPGDPAVPYGSGVPGAPAVP